MDGWPFLIDFWLKYVRNSDCCEGKSKSERVFMYSYSQKYFAFLKQINFKEKMLREGIILKYFSYILILILLEEHKNNNSSS